MSKAILLCFVITCFSFPVANGELTCYSCVMNAGETNRACENNPAAVNTSSPTVKCVANFCQIKRLEYSNHPGQIFTFYRGCTNDCNSGVTEGGGSKEYVRVCTTDLCNNWDGISSGPIVGCGSGGGSLLVPWKGQSGPGNQGVYLYVAIITFSMVMYMYR